VVGSDDIAWIEAAYTRGEITTDEMAEQFDQHTTNHVVERKNKVNTKEIKSK